MTQFIGNSRIYSYLDKVWRKGTWAHAYLLHGPEHVGKKTLALAFARTLLCPASDKTLGGCGACTACREDLRVSYRFKEVLKPPPEEKRASLEIGIGAVRELRQWLSFASGKTRVVLIDETETMSGDAANALLKILEEPQGDTVFLLISSAPEYILPTIRSRAVPLRFGLVSESGLQKMRGATEELVRLAQGRPGVLFTALNDKSFLKKRKELILEAKRVYLGSLADALSVSRELADAPEHREPMVEYLMKFLEKDLAVLNRRALPQALIRAKRSLRALKILETTNVNPRLATDITLLALQRPKDVILHTMKSSV